MARGSRRRSCGSSSQGGLMPDRKTTIRADLDAAYQALSTTAAGLSEADWQQASPNEGWRRQDILAHLSSIQARQRNILECAFGRAAWPTETVHEYNARMLEERRSWTVQQLRDELQRELATSL